MLRGFIKNFSHVIFHIFYRTKVYGIENIPQNSSAILCSNHINFLDSVCIVSHIKPMLYVMAKEELFDTKIKNWFMRDIGTFPVSREKGDMKALNYANELLKRDNLVLIFPEGTRNGFAKGEKFKKGAAYIAISSKVPVIPIGISGTFKPFSKIVINIGKPMDISTYVNDEKLDPRKVVLLTQKMQDEVIKLRDDIKI